MKIGIITFHHAKFSYGAMLQALATSLICKRFADRVELINYENRYEQKGVKAKDANLTSRIKRSINYVVRTVLFGGINNPYKSRKNIDKVYPCVSNQLYNDVSQMRQLEYDVLITGSDQVWNPELTGGVDPAFFLKFGTANKRISYASSMGTYILSKDEQTQFKSLLSDYQAISVRELHAKQQLKKIAPVDIKIVLDPTLLIRKEEWIKRFSLLENSKLTRTPYILTFFVSSGIDSYWKEIKEYVEFYKLPVFNIQAHKFKSKHIDKVIFAPEVSEFLRLILNATVVITNSFHGTAFSINFEKEFVPILSKNNPSRVINLLNEIGLSDRININTKDLQEKIDYAKVTPLLINKAEESYKWLRDNSLN